MSTQDLRELNKKKRTKKKNYEFIDTFKQINQNMSTTVLNRRPIKHPKKMLYATFVKIQLKMFERKNE